MSFVVKKASTQDEIQRIIELRVKVLRDPWSQPAATATDEFENTAVNAYIEENNRVVACGRLQENANKTGQIRFMAVAAEYQGKGLGKMIVEFLENEAVKMNLNKIELQARENAVEFYKITGYVVVEKSFLLWGLIQHYLMSKELRATD